MKKVSSKFHQGALTIIIIFLLLFGDFCGQSIKIWKGQLITSMFPSFNPCPSLQSVATTDNRKQFQCLNFILNNKAGLLFLECKWCQKKFKSSLKDSKWHDIVPLRNSFCGLSELKVLYDSVARFLRSSCKPCLHIFLSNHTKGNVLMIMMHKFWHNYNKILNSDWLSTVLTSALIGQCIRNRTVWVMPK